ncbi:hypothetical protein [Gibbsiella quercinecans]|uniref:Uncharacterized protein n=1 Tax=Gibbsiella quercinecans TaxID=929813 RepID=A0A250B416_9GAMM|nr:hypothetical protein [Gibbsiella quercinecans]ATA20816.1 hypothetical protein AWC35_16530 [Gibbsiella quercinecans]RLM10444.1 hypothetical protein BIY30_09620 [Gibbsiella quercinecans]
MMRTGKPGRLVSVGWMLRLGRIDCGLGELDLRHDDSSESPVSKIRIGATRWEAGSSFGKHRHMLVELA